MITKNEDGSHLITLGTGIAVVPTAPTSGSPSTAPAESQLSGQAKFGGHNGTYGFGGYTVTDQYLFSDRASAEAKVNEWVTNANRSGRVYQDSTFWIAELTETAQNDLVNFPTKNDLQPSLHGGRLSLPIERHPKFRMKWKYYVFSKDGSLPSGWASATADYRINDDEKYRISERLGDKPKNWKCVSNPTKPGVNTYDVSVYTVTDSIKCGSMQTAAQYVQSKLNEICNPSKAFGKTGNRMWKCDDATVTYNGKHFVATLTYTSAGDAKGWDEDIYP